MHKRAFVIAGDHAAFIANDISDFRYRAEAHCVPAGVQAPAQCRDHAETHCLVEDGIVEFMIGGATGIVLAGDFVRVPAGIPYAYRNAGDATARVLLRSVIPSPDCRAKGVVVTFAA